MRILALDVGERHTGVAISDPTETIARPLETIHHRSRKEVCSAVAALVAEHGAGAVVVGRPLSLDGHVGPQAQRVDACAEALAEALDVPVIGWDERFSTATADEILRETRKEKARRRARSNGEIDAIAAAVILQSYLDSQDRESRFG
jgi:putative Holliday junction resolvase